VLQIYSVFHLDIDSKDGKILVLRNIRDGEGGLGASSPRKIRVSEIASGAIYEA